MLGRFDATAGPAFEELAEIDRQRALDHRHVGEASIGPPGLQPSDPMLREEGDEPEIAMGLAREHALGASMRDVELVIRRGGRRVR